MSQNFLWGSNFFAKWGLKFFAVTGGRGGVQFLKNISIFSRYFSDKGVNFVYQLFDNNGSIKSWSNIKEEFDFNNISNFKWQQLIFAIPHFWKKNNKRNT